MTSRLTGPGVPAPLVVKYTLDDLDMVAAALDQFKAQAEDVSENGLMPSEDQFRKATQLLTYRRHCLAGWIRQQDNSRPALRDQRRETD